MRGAGWGRPTSQPLPCILLEPEPEPQEEQEPGGSVPGSSGSDSHGAGHRRSRAGFRPWQAACAPGPSGEHSKGEEVRPRSRLSRPAATSATGRTFHPLPGVLAATLAATQRRCYINSSCSQRRHLRAARRHLRGCRATRPETGESGEI